MTTEIFAQLETQHAQSGSAAVLHQLGEQLTRERKHHELFDVLLMQARHQLGLPVVSSTPIDDLPEPLRGQVEEAYLAACRQVGGLLLADGKLREAWMYLRPAGDKAAVAEALAQVEPNDENLQDLIEIGLHEGVAPTLGYRLVLKNYGTCNAITTFEGSMLNRPRADQQAAASLLLEHLYGELLANLRADIERQEGSAPQEMTIRGLIADRDWLFSENNYHVDTTHLAATVRFARLLTEPKDLELARELTEYGRRLSKQFQFAGEEPFADVYPAHGLFFAAQLGEQVEEALAYFRQKATDLEATEYGAPNQEAYIALLARIGRYDEAIRASVELLGPQTRTSGFAPSLLELSRLAGNYGPLLEACRSRGDLVGYAAGLVDRGAR